MSLTVRGLAVLALASLAVPALADSNDSGDNQRLVAGTSAQTAAQGLLPVAGARLVRDPRSAAGLARALGDAGIVLPAGGVDEACAGFPSLHRCLGALHIAKNVRVSGGFSPVREMLLYDEEASLGDVARAFAPEVDAQAAERTAQTQAMADLRKAGIKS